MSALRNLEDAARGRRQHRLGRSLIVVGLVLSALTLGFVVLVALDANALCLAPALMLAVPLLMRRYPGERILTALSVVGHSHWARPRSSSPRGARGLAVAPHGGLLIAWALAVRPPPAVHAAS